MNKATLFLLTLNLGAKLIATALFRNMSIDKFLVKVKAMLQAMINHPIPNLSPDTNTVDTEIKALETLVIDFKNLEQQMKAKTQAIKKQRRKVKDIFVDPWRLAVQLFANGDIEEVKKRGYGAKGIDDQKADPSVTTENSKPVFTETDLNTPLQFTFTVRNSKSGDIALPEDTDRCEVYESFGPAVPKGIKDMKLVGTTIRSKFTSHYTEDQVGLDVYYACRYIGKPSASVDSSELSSILKSKVV